MKKTRWLFTLLAFHSFLYACATPTGSLGFGSESSGQSGTGQSANSSHQSISWSLPLPKPSKTDKRP